MILSVSRRTDIPAFYMEWMMNRIREGFAYVRNPMNYHQVSRLDLSPEVVDGVVFWTKHAAPLIPYVEEIEEKYPFYVQYTLNGYGRDVEAHLPPLAEKIRTFQALSEKIGKERVIWRYDPILLSDRYTLAWHIKTFEQIARALSGYAVRGVFSFLDMYPKIKGNLQPAGARVCEIDEMKELAGALACLAKQYRLTLQTCAELIDLDEYGIEHGHCIDRVLLEQIIGCPLKMGKDKNQRGECGCVESMDVGQYNTCRHGCRYCYANFNPASVKTFSERHNVHSPFLVGDEDPLDKVTPRRNQKSLKDTERMAEESQILLDF